MTPLLSLIGAFLMGIIFGLVFFYALWLTAQKVLTSARPATWFLASWLTRMALVVTGFYWVAKGNWQLLLACLLGYIVGRWIISRTIQKLETGARHAT